MRVPWVFDSYSWPTNPVDDSDLIYELVTSEQVPINANQSTIQFGGVKTARRQIGGYIFGSNAMEHFNKMQGWLRNRTQATLTDHLGRSSKAQLVKFTPKIINDINAWKNNTATWQYQAEFIILG